MISFVEVGRGKVVTRVAAFAGAVFCPRPFLPVPTFVVSARLSSNGARAIVMSFGAGGSAACAWATRLGSVVGG